jgi:cellulose synthase (UDP-forming)
MLEDDKEWHKYIESGDANQLLKAPLKLPTKPKVGTKFPPVPIETPVSKASSLPATPVSHMSTLLGVTVQPTPVEEIPTTLMATVQATPVEEISTTLMATVQATPVKEIPTTLMATVQATPVEKIPTKFTLTLREKSVPYALESDVESGPQVDQSRSRFSSNLTALEKFATIRMKIITSILYKNTSTIVGSLQEGNEIHYKNVFSRAESWTLRIFTILTTLTTFGLIGWMLWPTHFSYSSFSLDVASISITSLMAITEFIRFAQSAALIFFAQRAKDPIALKPRPQQRVAILTTIVPGKEPLDLVIKTLQAMKRIRYDGIVDVWLLDEGNSPEVKEACEAIGVKHFSRKGIPEFNQPSGPFRAKTKHGNHNSWRAQNEQSYDIVAQMDPDHVPTEDFLLRTVGYFNDPDVGFVVAPQVYGNLEDSWIAKGSAILAYVFHGIIQRGGNGNNAPLLIGTNHVYKTACLKQINGYQDCIIEDHLTSMVVFATRNPVTGNYWKGVYTPDILAVGEGPTSFTDFFSQQMRWAYGIWEIATKFSPKLFPRMKKSQQFSFILLQMFYPSVAVTWILSNLVTIVYILLGLHINQLIGVWTVLWGSSVISSLGFFFWLRRFNLVKHEQKDSGLIGMVLMLMCIPVYTEAALRRLSGKPLSYVVTAKGKLTSGDNLRTFYPHLKWTIFLAGVLILNLLGVGSSFLSLRIWMCFNISICMSPIVVHYISRFRQRFTRPKHQTADQARV